MKTALLFPGQGAQHAEFLHRLPTHPLVRATLDEASAVLGHDALELDSAQALAASQAVQLATLIAGVAVARALRREGLLIDAVAGLSIGAFAAAVVCNSIDFADALSLVRLRGERMDLAYPKGYGMAALTGLNEQQVGKLIEQAGGAGAQLFLANVNAPRQMVVAGADAALNAIMTSAREAGARKAERLAVSVPSHCALLDPVSQALAEAIRGVPVSAPSLAYVSNLRGRVVRNAEGVRDDLVGNVAHTVRWAESVSVLYELGVRLYIEPPPGHVLSDLMHAEFDDARAIAVDDAGIDDVLAIARANAP